MKSHGHNRGCEHIIPSERSSRSVRGTGAPEQQMAFRPLRINIWSTPLLVLKYHSPGENNGLYEVA